MKLEESHLLLSMGEDAWTKRGQAGGGYRKEIMRGIEADETHSLCIHI